MKKVIVLLIAAAVLISCIFVSCKSNKEEESTKPSGLEAGDNAIGFEYRDVTDKDGKAVTDKNGKKVTEAVPVQYFTDKEGNTIGEVLDKDGNKTGSTVSVKGTSKTNDTTHTTIQAKPTTTAAPKPTGTTKPNVPATKDDQTSLTTDTNTVPKTSETGTEISFSIEDQEKISSMLEVPYLYLASYENADGIPISIAAHAAVWMAEQDGGDSNIYPSSPVVLNLFKYFGQTVVDFKTNCNVQNTAGAPIRYISRDDTFEISGFTPKKQTVVISKVEDLGKNNYFRVTGNVSNADGKTKVIAVIEKNNLDSRFGFSIKALKWS